MRHTSCINLSRREHNYRSSWLIKFIRKPESLPERPEVWVVVILQLIEVIRLIVWREFGTVSTDDRPNEIVDWDDGGHSAWGDVAMSAPVRENSMDQGD